MPVVRLDANEIGMVASMDLLEILRSLRTRPTEDLVLSVEPIFLAALALGMLGSMLTLADISPQELHDVLVEPLVEDLSGRADVRRVLGELKTGLEARLGMLAAYEADNDLDELLAQAQALIDIVADPVEFLVATCRVLLIVMEGLEVSLDDLQGMVATTDFTVIGTKSGVE